MVSRALGKWVLGKPALFGGSKGGKRGLKRALLWGKEVLTARGRIPGDRCLPHLWMALFFQLLVERSLAWRPSLVLICFMTLGESLLLSGPPISLKLPPTLKLFNFAEKLVQLQDWLIYSGHLAEETRTWVNLSSVMGGMKQPIYWVTFIPLSSVANCMTQGSLMFFWNYHGIPVLIPGCL